MRTAAPLTTSQRARLAEFDALLDDYARCDTASSMEHPLHDTLGALAVIVDRASPDTAFARRHAAIMRREHRLPVWLNPDGTFTL